MVVNNGMAVNREANPKIKSIEHNTSEKTVSAKVVEAPKPIGSGN